MKRAEQYITSQPFACVPQAHSSSALATPALVNEKKPLFPNLKSKLEKYANAKTGSVGEREILTINRRVNAYLAATKEPFSKRSAAAFFKWLATRTDEEIRNPFEGMGVKETTAPMDRRPAYSLNDLKRLQIALHGVKDWKRWIILIGRYSGMRQNEICQLYHNDVMKVDGVWCFRVDNLNPNQTLKTDSSRRFVPIHSQLLTLGLLDFFTDRKGHLFPELTLHLGSYGHYFSRWFTRFRGKYSLSEYHSLRHYAATTFKQNGFPEQFASQVLGHSNATITYNRYGKGIDISSLIALIETL